MCGRRGSIANDKLVGERSSVGELVLDPTSSELLPEPLLVRRSQVLFDVVRNRRSRANARVTVAALGENL